MTIHKQKESDPNFLIHYMVLLTSAGFNPTVKNTNRTIHTSTLYINTMQ